MNIPLHNELNYRIEKNTYSDSNFFSDIKPYRVHKYFMDSIHNSILIKNHNKIIFHLLNSDLFSFKKNSFLINILPVISILPKYINNTENIPVDYQLGLNINSFIGKKLSINFTGFYGISSFDDYWQTYLDSSGIVPHYGKFIALDKPNYHFWSLKGYISYQPWKYFNFEAGKDKNFFGEGYRSLFISDNSNSNLYFKTSVAIWKFRYIWLISGLKDENTNTPGSLKNKLQFSHYLSWNATKWLNLNFFESIISNPVDSVGVPYFNINYLNPVIFYRPVEFASGSADNALMGLGVNLKFLEKYRFYSQFLIDEFVISEIKAKNGWWGNKFAVQAGMKIYDAFGIKNLLLLGEINIIRPYTYSYSNSILNYGNYKQAIAHPSGANLKESVFIAHYDKGRFSTQFKIIYQISGLDTNAVSFGKNIYKSNTQRPDDYGHAITQGLKTQFLYSELKTSWFINSKSNTQFQITLSTYNIQNAQVNFSDFSISLGIKTLIFNENLDYLH
ncbi:MAG: hypothetical protein L3J74_07215 [Bacteroidales bacterium]|nr:hypothetical protein [Bacteroidales bacterium]